MNCSQCKQQMCIVQRADLKGLLFEWVFVSELWLGLAMDMAYRPRVYFKRAIA